MLLTYPASIYLGIVEFKVPNEANSHAVVDSITNTPYVKQVSFSTPLHYRTTAKKMQTKKSILKSLMKHKHQQNSTFQDHNVLKVQSLQDYPAPFQDPSTLKNHSLQDHSPNISVKDVQDIVSLKKAFPKSFDTTGNMPGVYAIGLDPSFPPIQHARRKVPTECREAIEKLLQDMVDQGIITPVTEPMIYVSSLTYPWKPDGSLLICLDPRDLNKAIVWEHYKAPTLDEISHKLSGAKVFSKLDTKDGYWSIHLDTALSYLTTFNTHKGHYWFLCMPFGIKNVTRCISDVDGPINR